jgi:hypothetical protein
MATSGEILSERINRVENIPDRFISRAAATQAQLFNELLTILESLGLGREGGVTTSAADLARIDALIDQYYQRVRQGEYGGLVAGFIDQMQKQQQLNAQYYEVEFGLTPGALSASVYQQSRQKALRQLLGDDFKTNFINVIRDQVVQSVEAGASFTQMRSDLFPLFTDGERLGQLHNWISQVTRDIFSVFDRAYNNSVAVELDLEFGQYAGGLVKDSRKFCTDRAGKFYHVKEVESWASEEWQGKYRRTNARNILDWLGGYNCMHLFAYRSIINVPDYVIERNIASGNYKRSR